MRSSNARNVVSNKRFSFERLFGYRMSVSGYYNGYLTSVWAAGLKPQSTVVISYQREWYTKLYRSYIDCERGGRLRRRLQRPHENKSHLNDQNLSLPKYEAITRMQDSSDNLLPLVIMRTFLSIPFEFLVLLLFCSLANGLTDTELAMHARAMSRYQSAHTAAHNPLIGIITTSLTRTTNGVKVHSNNSGWIEPDAMESTSEKLLRIFPRRPTSPLLSSQMQ